MVKIFKRLLKKFARKSKIPKPFKNRFQRFYYLNKEKISKERKQAYYNKKKIGICIKCKRKAVKGVNFCAYHRKQQEGYNLRQRKRH